MEGKLHIYHPSRYLNVFEYAGKRSAANDLHPEGGSQNVLLFVGGMFDNFGSLDYLSDIARLFDGIPGQEWRVMHVQLSSAMRGWGQFDLDRDVEEIGVCVAFIRQKLFGEHTKVVLMGHSTGCQDLMHYLISPNPPSPKKPVRPIVQGAILQAPVSDREGVLDASQKSEAAKAALDKCMWLINETSPSEHSMTFLPLQLVKHLFGPLPLTMSRFLSLLSPTSPAEPSSEDFFSSDLHDTRLKATFGHIASNGLISGTRSGKPSILILISNGDEHMPQEVDKQVLLSRWKDALEAGGTLCDNASMCVPNASHGIGGSDLKSQVARLVVLRSAIVQYLDDIVGGITDSARDVINQDRERLAGEDSTINVMGQNLKDFKL